MKTYHFKDDSWYDKPACDCCEGDWFECYNIDKERHPDFFQNGSAHSVEMACRQVLMHEEIIDEDYDEVLMCSGDDYELTTTLMVRSGLKVEMIK